MLTEAGIRSREFLTAVHPAFSLEHMPLTVASGSKQAMVEVDLSPHHWLINAEGDEAAVEVWFEGVVKLMRKRQSVLARE